MRLWVEPELSPDLRARITRTTDITSGEYAMDVFVGVEAICVFVREWLACAIYVAVALMWLVPDRRIERVIGSDGQ